MKPLLMINNLSVHFGGLCAVDEVTLTIAPREILGIAGESGSGKSVLMMAMMGLIKDPGKVKSDQIIFDGQDLKSLTNPQRTQLMGKEIGMIFQDPVASLNPSFTVGFQLMEILRIHLKLQGDALKKKALELMEQVEIPDAPSRLLAYPHQLSGGMCQRIGIAMAIACQPKLLIADEPTTALDVTIQSQIIELLLLLQKTHGMALILISHDLALIAQIADRVAMMYAGQIVEEGALPHLFKNPAHPYTAALLSSLPERSQGAKRLITLPGNIPSVYDRPRGCLFSPRCAFVQKKCGEKSPTYNHQKSQVRCYYPLNKTFKKGQRATS